MKKSQKILAFSKAAGGAAAIGPVCHAMLQEGWDVLLLAKDEGLNIFSKQGLECVNFPSFDAVRTDILVNRKFGSLPDLIFTSATSLPMVDMTEKYLWQWGKRNNITTVGLVDHWQNYALRFSGCGKDEKLGYLPDYIFVMDELAKIEMVKEGIPERIIVVTGQPAFDRVKEEHNRIRSQIDGIKNKLDIPSDFTIVTFVSEALKRDFGNSRGYDEQSTLEFLGNTLEEFCLERKDFKIYIVIKLHPENDYREFNWILSKWPNLRKSIIKMEISPRQTVAISDLVIGMTSILLVEAILANKLVLSLQLDSLMDSQLVATKVGAIPFIKSRFEGKKILSTLLVDPIYREKYLKKQKTWKIYTNSTQKCLNALKEIVNSDVSICNEGSCGI